MNDLASAASALTPPQYGTSQHWPTCRVAACTGCLPLLPPLPEQPARQLDLNLFRRDV